MVSRLSLLVPALGSKRLQAPGLDLLARPGTYLDPDLTRPVVRYPHHFRFYVVIQISA